MSQQSIVALKQDAVASVPVRRKLPDERPAFTHHFVIGGHSGYVTVGLYENGQPGEIFIVLSGKDTGLPGFADSFAQAISYALQYGVPLQVLVDKFTHVRFEPSGPTSNPEIRHAKSIVDYIFRWLALKFLTKEAQHGLTLVARDVEDSGGLVPPADTMEESPCPTCGTPMMRKGLLWQCPKCGDPADNA